MSYKFLQLNTELGRHWPRQEAYLAAHHYDIVQLQEVAGGRLSYSPDQADGFTQFAKLLKGYTGFMTYSRADTNPQHYSGNATFIDSTRFRILNKREIVIVSKGQPAFDITQFVPLGDNINQRSALQVDLEAAGHRLSVVNTHMPTDLTPIDSEAKLRAAGVLAKALLEVTGNLILSGDFNVDPRTKTAATFEAFGTNLARRSGLINTIDPVLHERAEQIMAQHPHGVAPDNIFTSPGINVLNFSSVVPHISDHRGLHLEFDFDPI